MFNGLLTLFGANPWKSFKAGATAIIVLTIILFQAAFFYSYYQKSKENTQLKVENTTSGQVIADQKEAAQITKDSNEVTDKAEVKVIEDTKQSKQQHQKRKQKVIGDVSKVNDDPVLKPDDKLRSVSTIYITSLWQEYCIASRNADPSCVNYPPPAKDNSTVLSEHEEPVMSITVVEIASAPADDLVQ